jgi:hypothetical protein
MHREIEMIKYLVVVFFEVCVVGNLWYAFYGAGGWWSLYSLVGALAGYGAMWLQIIRIRDGYYKRRSIFWGVTL